MNKNDYDRLTNLAALTELPGERDDFLESLIPFYKMMDSHSMMQICKHSDLVHWFEDKFHLVYLLCLHVLQPE